MTKDNPTYMKAIWNNFYDLTHMDPVSEELHHHLSQQPDKEQRKQLLKLVDCQNCYTEQVSFESFVAGFQLATGIARELEKKLSSEK